MAPFLASQTATYWTSFLFRKSLWSPLPILPIPIPPITIRLLGAGLSLFPKADDGIIEGNPSAAVAAPDEDKNFRRVVFITTIYINPILMAQGYFISINSM